MSEKLVYIFEEYMFYEGSNIVMISEDYDKVKECFDDRAKAGGYGYCIREYEYDKVYGGRIGDGKSIDWIEVQYNGTIKDLKKLE